MIKKGLGKGLGALITSAETDTEGVREFRINEIEPNINQPRKNFDDEKLKQLAESIKQHGVVQPLIVKKENDTYRIVAGERRWRAARLAGLSTVPVVIKDLSSRQVMEIALIENLQREDLNPLEEAEAYEKLTQEFGLTQEDISKTVGKSRSAVANSLRLLNLTESVKKLLVSGALTSGHARALLALEDQQLQKKAAEQVSNEDLNVRDTEKLVKRYLLNKQIRKKLAPSAEMIQIEEKLKEVFGTKVKLLPNKKKGKIMIEYYSPDELERILELFETISAK
jgi:ParB family chromosome partitioning protein